MKRLIGVLLTLVLLAGVGFAIFLSLRDQRTVVVRGLIGSEKKEFFLDEKVQRILKDKYNLEVDFEKVGSRLIATQGGADGPVSNYDFAFPAGIPAAEKIRRDYDVKKSYRVFFTPMAVASWKEVTDVLEANEIVSQRSGYYGIVDMRKLMKLMETDTRWEDLPNNQEFSVGRRVLLKSTNILSSNSAAMYLSLASYLTNNDTVVKSSQQVGTVVPQVSKLFTDQGFLPSSSATPFEDYLIKGMGNSPLVMVYESQFLYYAASNKGNINKNMVLLYPEPTIFTQHELLAMTDAGVRLGEALTTDQELQKLAIKNGYRSNDVQFLPDFQEFIKKNNLSNIPSSLNEVIDPPSYEIIEEMINSIEVVLLN